MSSGPVRRLILGDLPAARLLGAEAFGHPAPGAPEPPPIPTELPANRYDWGLFELGPDGERLAAKAVGLSQRAWFGGRRVACCGVAGVAVAAEDRGRGSVRELLAAVLGEARERGEVLSTMFPTAPGIYRSLGYEIVTSLDTVSLPSAELAGVRAPEGVRTRRAGPGDLATIRAVHETWAAAQNGPLERTGPDVDDLLDRVSAVALALDETDAVLGYLTWQRGHGYDASAVLEVEELLALSEAGYRALWEVAGSFASVTPTVRLQTSGGDPARLVLPGATWNVADRHPCMLRVLDLPGAVAAVGPTLPAGAAAEVELVVSGDRLGLVDGGFRLTLSPGTAQCAPGPVGNGASALDVRGLALLVAGAQSCGNLRLLGLLGGGSPDDDRVLDAAFGGRPVHVRDYF